MHATHATTAGTDMRADSPVVGTLLSTLHYRILHLHRMDVFSSSTGNCLSDLNASQLKVGVDEKSWHYCISLVHTFSIKLNTLLPCTYCRSQGTSIRSVMQIVKQYRLHNLNV